jgi:heme/copper-type cytochrome/quinol oxidase subunit 2
LLALAAYALLAAGGALMYFVSPWAGIPVMVVAYLAMLVFSVILMIQRLHDLNKTGWMWLLALVPLANLYLFVILIFFKGTPGRNNYGLQTPPNKTWHWILALGFPVLMLIAVFAVALPAYNQYLEASQSFNQFDMPQDSLSEYPEDGASPDATSDDQALEGQTLNDEALEDGISYEAPEDTIIEDAVTDSVEAEVIDETNSDTTE